jgi:hypothetical protein
MPAERHVGEKLKAKIEERDLSYGAVYVEKGRFRGRVMYYDDMEFRKTAVCYTGVPIYCRGYYHVPYRYLREPTIEELLDRNEKIGRSLMKFAIDDESDIEAEDIHDLWLEKELILGELQERRMAGEVEQIIGEKTVFLCHSSADKGFVRMVNDDLRRLGATTWLDENNIKVGESIVEKISDGLKSSQFLAIFLSPDSVKSKWALREWQSFISVRCARRWATELYVAHCRETKFIPI